jgi:hypothetical protein
MHLPENTMRLSYWLSLTVNSASTNQQSPDFATADARFVI